MFLQKLCLTHFRNYAELDLDIKHRVNIFLGDNAQGKTNLLEAIYAMALTKSHRLHKEKELIQWGQDTAVIYGEVRKKYGLCKLSLQISKQGKKAKINGGEQRKLSHYIGHLNVVMFAPEDLEIVKGSPSVRRRFLDMEIGQVHPSYLHHLALYQKALMQRNNLLKLPDTDELVLEIWDEQLAVYGTKIMQKRQQFINKMQEWSNKIHSGITNGKEQLEIRYRPSFEVENFHNETVLFEHFMLKLSQMKEQERRRGITLVGPHRDDLVFYINGKEAEIYGSQGQQRTAALSLKLAEIELIRQEVGEYPVLLLDDVLSELDPLRQTQLIETFQDKVQTFITTTSIDSVHFERLNDAAVYRVREGSVQ